MYRSQWTAALWAALLWIAAAPDLARALDVVWDGGDGLWDEANWNGGMYPIDIVGTNYGSQGYASLNGGDDFIISGTDSVVTYDADFLMNDFRIKQGSSLTVEDGATWSQPTAENWSENRWTEYDGDSLVIDGGTFSRLGSVPGEGGGALIFGSWMGDDNFDNPLSELDHQEINITITGGGRLENEGQLWFGGWGDTAPNGTVVTMTINDGTVDLTGGDVPDVGDEADGDLVFTNRFLPSDTANQPTYVINFTGPGSITVDSSGIVNASKNEADEWVNLDPVTYEALWDAGILQANGQSGVDGEDFANYFTVTGELGMDDYTLTFAPGPGGVTGDYNGNGTVEQADLDLVLLNWGGDGSTPPAAWVNDLPDGTIDQAELDGVLLNWGNAGAGLSAASVPEPAAWLLGSIALVSIAAGRYLMGRRAA
jgi:hypothetical protein